MIHKSKIIQILFSSNFIYRVIHMIRFFTVYLYWTPHFLHEINLLSTKIKKFKWNTWHKFDYIYIYIENYIRIEVERTYSSNHK